jgi:hypothetical protein
VGAKYEAAGREVLRPYGLTPVLMTHYAIEVAIRQKVHALAARTEPQARDVFDLALLLARPEATKIALGDDGKKWLPGAVDRAMGLSYGEYASKVVAFLEPSQAEVHADRSAWEAMQEDVVARLEALR